MRPGEARLHALRGAAERGTLYFYRENAGKATFWYTANRQLDVIMVDIQILASTTATGLRECLSHFCCFALLFCIYQ